MIGITDSQWFKMNNTTGSVLIEDGNVIAIDAFQNVRKYR